jgi:hypothetical protein
MNRAMRVLSKFPGILGGLKTNEKTNLGQSSGH